MKSSSKLPRLAGLAGDPISDSTYGRGDCFLLVGDTKVLGAYRVQKFGEALGFRATIACLPSLWVAQLLTIPRHLDLCPDFQGPDGESWVPGIHV